MYRDFSARYRQSILGYIWAIIPSVATVIIFTYLTSHRVLPIGNVPLPYPIFALWSISVWHLFAGSLAACTNSLVSAGSLVTKINFPKETLVIASVGQAVIEFIIRLLPIVAVMLWYGISPPWQSIFIPLILVPVLFLAIGLGFFLSILNLAIRDIGSAVGMVLTFGMFAAPVLYPPPHTYPFFLVNILNPFSPLLIATQDLLAYGELRHEALLVAAVLFAFLLFLIGWRIFYIIMPRVAERA
jgi:lipopolysaccharide transport system permease protein